MAPKKFYLTTPIYYVNARPHIGHAYTTIVADVLARRHRLLGDETFFLTGTDEHGQKIERSAAAAGIPPQQFADQVSASFEGLWKRMGITHNDYIRTTEPRHKLGAQKLFRTLYERGFIYLASYTGSYCVSDEAFVDAPVGTPCPDCGRLLEEVTEENFFFKLSEFQQPLIDLIESGNLLITPDAARNEVLSFVKGGLKDLSISRSSFTWGIPVPEPAASAAAQKHVIYVWLDALANYMTALGYGSEDESLWQKFWPADLHLVGKEITRFHCVYWPAFLLAAGLPTPKQITANGWLLFDNAKMSKSKGNIVRTETILDAFGTLCPPVPVPAQNPVILSEEATRNEASNSLSTHPNPVILSEGAEHHPAPQSKDLLVAGPATTAKPISTSPFAIEPPTRTESTDRRGTASAVPSTTAPDAALAAEVRLPTPAERDLFATDILRYHLLREIPFGQDGSFSFDAMITRYNADLANGYGNLVSRTLSMIEKYFEGVVPASPSYTTFIVSESSALQTQIFDRFVNGNPSGNWQIHLPSEAIALSLAFDSNIPRCHFIWALQACSELIRMLDSEITSRAPWKAIIGISDEEMRQKRSDILYLAAESIRIITVLLYPILPYATARVWAQLGLGDIELAAANGELKDLQWGGLKPGTKLGPLAPIFPRADKGLAQIMIDMENIASSSPQTPATTDPAAGPRTATLDEPTGTLPVAGSTAHTTGPDPTLPTGEPAAVPTTGPADASPQIAIDDFIKIELRVAQVLVCERIPKADKLLRLEVDLGYETRQILSGIAEFYTPEEMVGRRIIVITNLAPRKMRGLESHGMLLAASEEGGKPFLATVPEGVPVGTRLK
jgi:methionyl-tRNA synthetase